MQLLKTLGGIALVVLLIDFVCFCAWVMSGQHPADGFYFGTITAHILKMILAL